LNTKKALIFLSDQTHPHKDEVDDLNGFEGVKIGQLWNNAPMKTQVMCWISPMMLSPQ
jgi:hypothetical protein